MFSARALTLVTCLLTGLAMPPAAHADDGALDSSFGSGGFAVSSPPASGPVTAAEFRSVVLEPNGKYVALGTVQTGSGSGAQTRFVIARYNADGTLDNSFGSSGMTVTGFAEPGRDEAAGLVRLANGELLAAGTVVGPQGGSQPGTENGDKDNYIALAKYFDSGPNAGRLDPSFGNGGTAVDHQTTNNFVTGVHASAVAVTNGTPQQILVGGRANLASQNPSILFVRYNENGQRIDEESLEVGAVSAVNASLAEADGGTLLAGYEKVTTADTERFLVVRLLANRRFDPSFHGASATFGGSDGARALSLARASDGYVAAGVARFSTDSGNEDRIALAKWRLDGQPASEFGSGGTVVTRLGNGAEARSVLVQPDNKVVVAGSFFGSGTHYLVLLRYLPNGQLDRTFGGDGTVLALPPTGSSAAQGNALVRQSDGRLTAAGGELSSGGSHRYLLARFGRAPFNSACGSVLGCGSVQPVTAGSGSNTTTTGAVIRAEMQPCTTSQTRCDGVGILVRRIVRTVYGHGRRSYVTRLVGRVPFGLQRPGTITIRWNLRVNGRRLPPGRYLINIRALKGKRVIEVSPGFALNVITPRRH